MAQPVNNHHLLWPKYRYDTDSLKNLRNHPSLVVPMLVEVHADLHASLNEEMRSSPLPHKKLARDIIGLLGVEKPARSPQERLEAVQRVAAFCLERESDNDIVVGLRIYDQIPYLEEGLA